jgi:FlaA1/EpsC-like NDP-sugar epimerase
MNKILIYGAGKAGKKLINILLKSGTNILGIIDENKKIKKYLSIPIYREKKIYYFIKKNLIDSIIFAIPSVNLNKKNKLIKKILRENINILNLQNDVVLKNHVGVNDIKDINPEILLNKDIIKKNNYNNIYRNKIVFITGGAGSIGRSLVEKLIKLKLNTLIINDISEYGLYKLEEKINLIKKKFLIKTKVIIMTGDLSNNYFLINNFKKFKIDYIFHCAAYKHVNIVEKNISEGFYNNIVSTYNLLNFSKKQKSIKSFLFISTDKAYKPKNFMGATKRFCEKMTISSNLSKQNKFKVVRFGNVFASDGSFIPKMFNQIKNDESVTITHKNMSRFFLSTDEACELIISASTFKKKFGDIMFFDMGTSIKIIDLAKKISKYLNKKLKIKIIGIRNGEKISESLHDKGIKKIKTNNKKIYAINDSNFSFLAVDKAFIEMFSLYKKTKLQKLKKILFLHSQ